jgi:multiple sugar transport system permease protein
VLTRSEKNLAQNAAIFIVLVAVAALVLLPFYWTVVTSLKTEEEAVAMPPRWIPSRFVWENYRQVWQAAPFGNYFFNSVLCSFWIVVADVASGVLAAYAFARLRFKGKEVVFILLLWTLMFPEQIFLIPRYLIVSWLGWRDTYAGLILPRIVHINTIFLLRQFFEGLPKDLEDAAVIDGCGDLRKLWNVIVPLSKPAISALVILRFMWSWGAFFWPLIVVSEQRMRTLPLGLSVFKDEFTIHWNLLMGATVVTMIPPLLVYIFFQRRFIQGVTFSGLKS